MITRRKIYGDIIQNVDLDELEALLRHFNNNVPKVIGAIECKVLQRGTRTFIPPAFYGRDGTFYRRYIPGYTVSRKVSGKQVKKYPDIQFQRNILKFLKVSQKS